MANNYRQELGPGTSKFCLSLRFPSIDEFTAYAIAGADKKASSHTGSKQFTGTDSFDEAINLARNGWDEGLRKAEEVVRKILPSLLEHQKDTAIYYRDDGGMYVDVDRYLVGDPDVFVAPEPEPAVRHVQIYVHVSRAHYMTVETINCRGAGVMAAVLAMRARGVAADVYACSSVGYNDSESFSSATLVSDGRVAFDPDTLAFALIHPSFWRRIGFAVSEAQEMFFRTHHGFTSDGGYGQSRKYPHVPQSAVYVPHQTDNEQFDSIDKAVALAKKICADAGVELAEGASC